MSLFVIKHEQFDQLFWSTSLGWVETELETKFDRKGFETFDLPMHGVWVTA